MKQAKTTVRNPYNIRYFYKRNFFHKTLLGAFLDHRVRVYLANKCVTIISQRDQLFTELEIETINRCNSTCSFCPVNKFSDSRSLSSMSDDLFHKIADELADLDYQGKLALHSNNEPLLDDRLASRVRYAKGRCPNAFVYIYTNGTLLDTSKALDLLEAGIDKIRIDNYGDGKKLHRNIKELVDNFQTPAYRRYAPKIQIVIRKLNEVLSNRGGTAPNKPIQDVQTYRYYQDASCRFPFSQLVIRPDGKVSLCCNDAYGKVTLGDVTKTSLVDIWFGDRYKQLRRELLKNGRKNLSVCKVCDVHTFEPGIIFRRNKFLSIANRVLKFSSNDWK